MEFVLEFVVHGQPLLALKTGRENCVTEDASPEPINASESSITLPPSKGKWIRKEVLDFQRELMTDIAYALNHGGNMDLIEAFCSKDSMLTKVACQMD